MKTIITTTVLLILVSAAFGQTDPITTLPGGDDNDWSALTQDARDLKCNEYIYKHKGMSFELAYQGERLFKYNDYTNAALLFQESFKRLDAPPNAVIRYPLYAASLMLIGQSQEGRRKLKKFSEDLKNAFNDYKSPLHGMAVKIMPDVIYNLSSTVDRVSSDDRKFILKIRDELPDTVR